MEDVPPNPLAGLFIPATGVFVAGTDTGVGKTVIAGALAILLRHRGTRVGVFKPVATGGRVVPAEGVFPADAEFLAWAADTHWDIATICPAAYAEPVAPLVAARHSGRDIELDELARAYNLIAADSQFIVVEGIGGLLVPLTVSLSVADLAAAMNLPLVLVARPSLGTINHTLLTVEAARRRGLTVAAVVLNRFRHDSGDLAEQTNPDVLAELTGLPVCLVPDTDDTSVDPAPAVSHFVLAACARDLLVHLPRIVHRRT